MPFLRIVLQPFLNKRGNQANYTNNCVYLFWLFIIGTFLFVRLLSEHLQNWISRLSFKVIQTDQRIIKKACNSGKEIRVDYIKMRYVNFNGFQERWLPSIKYLRLNFTIDEKIMPSILNVVFVFCFCFRFCFWCGSCGFFLRNARFILFKWTIINC